MKKIFTAIAIFLFFATFSSYAQFGNLTPFTAKDANALKAGKDQSVTDGLKVPKLLFIGTFAGSIPVQGITLDVKVDMEKGTATTWAYSYYDSLMVDSVKTYAVIKLPIVGTFMAVGIPFSMISDNLPFLPTKPLDNTSWKPVESLKDSIKNNPDFSAFKAANSDWAIQMLGLGMNTENPMFQLDKPYWIITFNAAKSSITCFTQAETGETVCIEIPTGINDNPSESGFAVYPNPAQNHAIINIPKEIQTGTMKMKLVNSNGELVRDLFTPQNQETDKLLLNTSELANGVYMLILNSGNKHFSTKLLINR